MRNTPTGVGKTVLRARLCTASRKHPHGRGEDTTLIALSTKDLETPPRAWGRLHILTNRCAEIRNTPTGVGKTGSMASTNSGQIETPPRAWGRHFIYSRDQRIARNTPTGVGKTLRHARTTVAPWKHPHGRGEDLFAQIPLLYQRETPPRAWGRP